MHLEITCPGCEHRSIRVLSESGKSDTCLSCGSTFVVPQLGHPILEFTLSEKAKEMGAALRAAQRQSHLFLRLLSALFIVLAVLKFALAVWSGAAYFSPTGPTLQIDSLQSPALNNVIQNLPQRSRGRTESVLRFVAVLSSIECIAFIVIARWLRRTTHYAACFLIAILACLTIPFGMALGVATIVVLMDRDISQTFLRQAKSQHEPLRL